MLREDSAVAAAAVRARPLATKLLAPTVGFGLPALAVLVAIFVIRPYYGVMDDAALLSLVEDVGRRGFFDVYGDKVWADIWGWGMVRPLYWALAYVHYSAGSDSATVLHVVNWAATSGALLAIGYGLARAFRVPAGRRPLFLGLYGAAAFVFPWTLDLYAFPSLQEKWVFLAAALALVWFADPRAGLPAWLWYATSAAVLGLGAATKAQFLIFAPAVVLVVADQRRRRETSTARVVSVAAACVAIAVGLSLIGAHGSYTSQFGPAHIDEQLHSHYLWLLGVLTAAWTVYAVARARRGGGSLLTDLIPTATFCAFVVVFAQWTGFIFPLLAPAAAGAFALAVSRFADRRLIAVVLTGATVWAVAWVGVRLNELYGSLASIGEFVHSAQARQLAARGEPVYISCQEGSGAIAAYLRRQNGGQLNVQGEAGVPWTAAGGSEPPPQFKWALADAHLCPALIAPGKWVAVWRPSAKGGFVLYRRS
jgi:hypothetical protein